ncbi:MAG: NAD(P)-dependent oxidoreductase [Gaiellaceae bacterium]
MKSAFILGGTGQIGTATAKSLRDAGWEVTTAARNGGDVRIDRKEGLDLPGEYDALVDCIAFTADDGAQLLGLAGRVGSLVVVSSASVYADDDGWTLDEAGDNGFPEFPDPIPETQRTIEPGDANYSTRKRALELALLEQDAVPATIVRPCAIHGPHSKSHVREWYFVKRADDRRPFVLLAHNGDSRFHTTSTPNLAELIRLACEQPGSRAFNGGDPDPPTTAEISRTIAELTGHERIEYLLPDAPEAARNPWAVPRPLVVSMEAAERELGYRPVTTYPEAVSDTVAWLLDERPPLDEYMATMFDYEAEDEFVRTLKK